MTGPALDIGYESFSAVVESGGLALLALDASFEDMFRHGSTVQHVTSIGSFRVIPAHSAVGTAKAVGESIVWDLCAELADRGPGSTRSHPGGSCRRPQLTWSVTSTLSLRNTIWRRRTVAP